jgi:hypothetical protein
VCFLSGHYEVHVKDGNLAINASTLCRSFSFTGSDLLKKNNKAVECQREMTGDTIVVKRTDGGALRLYEVYPISKYVWMFLL